MNSLSRAYSNIVVTGSLSWDIIMDFPNQFVNHLQPDKLHQINVSFVVDNLEKQMGGTGTNIAFAVSEASKAIKTLNPKSETLNKSQIQNLKDKQVPVYLLGGLGKDGKEHLEFFKKNNINTQGIVSDPKRYSASGTVITDIKDNQIWGFYYGACDRGKDADFKQFVKQDSLMIISANHPDAFLTAQNYAIKHKIDYMYDCGMALSWISDNNLQSGVNNCRWLVGNDYEISAICKQLGVSVDNLVAKGITVITTLGEKGVRYERQIQISNSKIEIPAFKGLNVVDPTGAGDAWRGGFLSAILFGMDTQTSLTIGNVMASFVIESYGTVNYRVSKEEFEKRMKELGLKVKRQKSKGKS